MCECGGGLELFVWWWAWNVLCEECQVCPLKKAAAWCSFPVPLTALYKGSSHSTHATRGLLKVGEAASAATLPLTLSTLSLSPCTTTLPEVSLWAPTLRAHLHFSPGTLTATTHLRCLPQPFLQ